MRHYSGIGEDRFVKFDAGFDITATSRPLGFKVGQSAFAPHPELRSLSALRPALRDPNVEGPDPVYAIVMDIGKLAHRRDLQSRMLLFGAVTYAKGRLGDEVVRSQGHVHKVSSHSGWKAPEIYEIWNGRAFIYMQEFAADHPGRCFAVEASAGDIVIVPPGWAHTSMSAAPAEHLTFGALCDREYGFEYEEVRRRHGLAWYALLDSDGKIYWEPNRHYEKSEFTICTPREYKSFGIERGRPLYSQFERAPDNFRWVSKPALVSQLWKDYSP
jgi:glucose-6-phosphate isomerase, archaeal